MDRPWVCKEKRILSAPENEMNSSPNCVAPKQIRMPKRREVEQGVEGDGSESQDDMTVDADIDT